MSIVAIDLDGVLAYYNGWKGIDHIGEPTDGALRLCEQLIEDGHEIIVHTVRTNPIINNKELSDVEASNDYHAMWLSNKIYAWLKKHNFPSKITVWDNFGKPQADLYIDDKAFVVLKNRGFNFQTIQAIKALL